MAKGKKFFAKTINKNTVLPILFSGLASVISIATTFFIAKPIGSVRYGQIQYWIGIVNTLSALIAFGFPSYLAKNAQFNKDHPKAFFSKSFIWMLFIAAVSLPIFFFVAYFFLSGLNRSIVLILILFFDALCTSASSLIGSFCVGTGKSALGIFLQSFLPRLLLFAFSITFVWFSLDDQLVASYPFAYLIAFGVPLIPFLFFSLSKTSLKTTRPLVLDLSVFFVLDLSATIQSYLSRVLMNESSGNYSAVGIFSLSLQIIQIGSLFSGIITNISRPQFAKLAGSKDELLAFFNQITRINCYIAIPFLMAFIVQAPNVLSLFGQSYTEYPYMLIFLGIAYLVLNISGPIGTMLIMCGHEKMELLNTGASLLIYFILGFSLSHVTIYGLTIAILGMNIVSALTKIIEACKIFKRSPYSFKDILFIALLICLSGIIFLNLSFITSTTRWLIANVLVGSLTIVLFFVLTPYKNDKYFFFSKK